MLLLLLTTRGARADVTLPPQTTQAIQINATAGETWTEGVYRVWSLRDGCEITQGDTRITGREAVLWIEPGSTYGDQPWKVIAYVEGQVSILVGNQPQPTNTAKPGSLRPAADAGKQGAGQTWFGRLYSNQEPRIRIANLVPKNGTASMLPPDNLAARQTPLVARAWQQLAPPVNNAVYNSAPNSGNAPAPVQRADGASAPALPANPITRSQYAEYGAGPSVPVAPVLPSNAPGMRKIQLFPRSNVPLQFEILPNPAGTETTVVLNSGVQVRVDGLGSGQAGPMGNLGSTIDISADRVVLWIGGSAGNLAGGLTQSNDQPLEIYMEGDIVFREGDRVIFAQAMYYNVPLRNGVILNAELLTPVPNYAGLVRLRSNVIRQLDDANFVAEGASLTTSRLAMPTYEVRAGTLALNDTQIPKRNPITGLIDINPLTGEPEVEHRQTVTATNNVVMAGGVPFFYWPVLQTDLQKPTFFVNDFSIGNDNVFGTRGSIGFDTYQLLGVTAPPANTDWDVDFGYMSKRGFNAATKFTYGTDFIWGNEKPFRGLFDAFYIHDSGLDTLGTDRINMVPEARDRYRFFGQHRQILDNGWQISGELGIISDRNFLEQYFEREWDDQKDKITGIELKRIFDNQSLALALDYNPNEFFLRVNQLPRVDYFNLGSAVFENRATTYLHANAGYFQTRMATTPTAPQDAATFSPLPYEQDLDLARFDIRPNIEFPIPFADTKITPFLLGGATHFGETLNGGGDNQRLFGQAGIKTTLPFTSFTPEFESELLNVHGIAHKVNWDFEYSYTDATQNVDQYALVDEIDDDNVQHFRRRLAFQDFNGPAPVPARFDERFYAVRRGLMDNVTGPTEIVDDLSVARLGLRNRWQTKRGPEGNRRIIDWVTFDTHFEIFPNKDDNFGENAGLVDYDFRWFVGDRLTLLSSGAADFFNEGQRYVQIGAQINRPKRGNVYIGYRSMAGPFDADLLLASINYRLSSKWVGSAGITYQFNENGALGETVTLTRVGESFLVSVAFNADQTRDNIGATLYIEPRFLPRTRFGRTTSLDVPLAGQYGFE